MAALICIKLTRGTYFDFVNTDIRVLRIFSDQTLVKIDFQGVHDNPIYLPNYIPQNYNTKLQYFAVSRFQTVGARQRQKDTSFLVIFLFVCTGPATSGLYQFCCCFTSVYFCRDLFIYKIRI